MVRAAVVASTVLVTVVPELATLVLVLAMTAGYAAVLWMFIREG